MASLDDLFPYPSPPSALAPQRWPGSSHESTLALLKTLKDNHERWHCFFNEKGYHNHTAHHLLATYALGADPALIEAAYASDLKTQKKAYASPGPIDASNFNEHLGDEDYYSAYLTFFSTALIRDGIPATLEKHIFSREANIGPEGSDKHPHMLVRLFEGLLHPLIHAGNGAEFGLPGVLAEGLALAAVHRVKSAPLMPPSLFNDVPAGPGETGSVRGLSRLFATLSPFGAPTPPSTPARPAPGGPHALEILAKVLADPTQAPPPEDEDDSANSGMLAEILSNDEKREHLRALAEEWARGIDLNIEGALAAKLEEIGWMCVLMYAVGGWKPSDKEGKEGTGDFKADFFLMHLVTSSLFLSSFTAYLTPTSQRRLLVAYFITVLAAYVARGRPALALDAYFARPAPALVPPGPHPTPHRSALHPRADAPSAAGVPDAAHAYEQTDASAREAELHPNAWLAIVQSALFHPEEHVTKCVRALAHYARAYGRTPRGTFAPFAEGDHPLVGAEAIDGSLFVRAAAMTMGRVGWTREGEEARFWDRL